MDLNNIDYGNLSPDLKAKLMKWEANSPPAKQLQAIQDMGKVLEEIFVEMQHGKDGLEQYGALLTDIRTSIASLDAKEAPETPDFAQPVVDTLKSLETALTDAMKAITVQPQFKPSITVDAPPVNVTAPKVDLSGVQKVMQGIPQALRDAIASIPEPPEIPEPDFTPVTDALIELSAKLDSIDTGVRLKPLPGKMNVTNTDGTDVRSPSIFREFDDIKFTNADANGNYQTVTFKKASVTQNVLTMAFDGSSKVTSIVRA